MKGILTDGGEDRISSLPESLIHHILSFLLMRDVVRTCLLSKRWRNIWKSVHVLNFGKVRNEFIDHSLIHYDGQKVKKLQVEFEYWACDRRVESLVRFAVTHCVEELVIITTYIGEYMLPRCLFECLELRVLRFTLHKWTPQPFFYPLLTELHFMGFNNSNDLDTSACPLLEVLIVEGPHERLDIYAPNPKLRYLKIRETKYFYDYDANITVYAPNLLYFELQGYFRRYYEVKDLSSVKTANIQSLVPDECGMTESLVLLLRNLTHVKSLKLCPLCIKIFAYAELTDLEIPSFSATSLELTTNLSRPFLVGIASLLRASRCIEQLKIHMEKFEEFGRISLRDHDVVKAWELLEHALSAEVTLNTIFIQNYLGCQQQDFFNRGSETNMEKFLEYCDFEIKLVEVLLKSSKMLNKMNISIMKLPSTPLKLQFLDCLTKKLLVFPRAFSNAEVYFS